MWWEGRSGRGDRTGEGPGRPPDWGRGGCLQLRGGTGPSACRLTGVRFVPVPCLRPCSAPDAEFSVSSADLDAEHAQKVLETEHTQQAKLKERQKFFEEAFQQDMEQYLSTGYLQIAERRGKWRGAGGRGQRGPPWEHGDGVTLLSLSHGRAWGKVPRGPFRCESPKLRAARRTTCLVVMCLLVVPGFSWRYSEIIKCVF